MKKISITIASLIIFLLPAFAHADITSNLVARYKFDEGVTNAPILDASGNGNTATASGTPLYQPPKIGLYSLGFVGASSQAAVTPLSNSGYTNGSVSWWQYNTSSTYNDGAINVSWGNTNQYSSPQYKSLSFQKFSDNNIYAGWNTCVGTDDRVIVAASSSNYPTNTWIFYTITWTAGSLTSLYANGTLIAGNAGTTNVCPTGANIIIGELGNFNAEGYFNGDIDDFRVYNRTLTSADVTQLYQFNDITTVFHRFIITLGRSLSVRVGKKLTIGQAN